MKFKIGFILLILGGLLNAGGAYYELTQAHSSIDLTLASLLLYFVAVCFLLFSKVKLKSKLVGGLVFLATWFLFIVVNPHIKNMSYRHFEEANRDALQELISTLASKDGSIDVNNGRISAPYTIFTPVEKTKVLDLLEKLALNRVSKGKDFIFFETWGMLDHRRGIRYNLVLEKWDF